MQPFLIGLVVRAAAFLAAAWLVAVLLRRHSASVRAFAWSIAFVGLLLLPVLTMAMPSWRLEVWPAASSAATMSSAATTHPLDRSSTPGRAVVAMSDIVRPENVDVPTPDPVSRGDEPAMTGRDRSVADWLLWLSLAVSTVLTIRLVLNYRATASIVRSGKSGIAVPSEWLDAVERVRSELNIRQDMTTRLTGRVNVPAVAGIGRPVLLLPLDAVDWPSDVRRAIVLHELAHVMRRDALSQLFGSLACSMYWFLPPVWIAAQRAAILRERASDDVVLRAGVRPSAYANGLVELVRQATSADVASAALAMARPSRMRERVSAILDPVTKRDPMPARRGIAYATVAAAVILGVASLTLVAREATTATQLSAVADAGPAIAAPPAARPASTARATQSTPARPVPFCDTNLSESSSSLHEDNGRRSMTVKFTGRDCSVELRTEGKIDYNADFTDVVAISAGGFFKLDATDAGVRRQLDIEPGNGQLMRTYRVDGRDKPWDSDARTWFAAFLIALDRHTAIGVDVRLPALLKRGGVDAVLAETGLMSGDYARDVYFKTLAKTTKLSPADTAKMLKQASALAQSDYYATQVLGLVAGQLDNATVRVAAAEVIARMKSDYYITDSITKLAAGGKLSGAELDVLLKSAVGISSDYYRQQILSMLLRSGLSGDQLAVVIQAGTKIGNDYYCSEFLKSVLSAGALTERDLLSLVTVAKRLGSDHYKSGALVGIASHRSATEAVRTAVLDAASSMASYYNDQVKRSIRK